jgi:hypothetical protein
MCSAGFGCGPARRACTTDAECADGVRCTLDRCQDGRFCENVPQSGLCDNGQVCFAALGCIVAPPATCARDQDCERTRCGGRWTCQPELGCAFRARTDCDDRDACTTDRCDDAQGCLHTPRDGDNDTHGDRRCGGDDCDDTNPRVHPGATEVCNGLDDDCNGVIDDDATLSPAGTSVRVSDEAVAPSAPGGVAWTGMRYAASFWGYEMGKARVYFAAMDRDGTRREAQRAVTTTPNDAFGAAVAWTGNVLGAVWQDRRDAGGGAPSESVEGHVPPGAGRRRGGRRAGGVGGGGRAGSHERASTCPVSQLHLPSSQVPSFRTSSLVTSSPRH